MAAPLTLIDIEVRGIDGRTPHTDLYRGAGY